MMSNSQAGFEKLAVLSELVLDRELACLAEISGRRDDVQSAINQLDDELRAYLTTQQVPQPGEISLVARYDQNWQEWRRRKKQSLNITLANLEAEREQARAVARKAFGRNQAVANLIQKTTALAKSLSATKP